MYEKFNVSKRNNENLIILGSYSNQFLFNGSQIWNSIIKAIAPNLAFSNIVVSVFKSKLKSHLLKIQTSLDPYEWLPQNFLL